MTYAEFFSEFKNRFIGIDVSDINEHLAYQFCIEDEEAGGIFYVEVKDGQLYVEPYEYYDKDANFICNTDLLIKIAEGKIDPVKAYTTGKLKVEGNIDKALKLKEIVEHKKAQAKKAAKKTNTNKTTAKKTTANKTVAKKTTTRKTTTRKTTAKKTEAK